jgi:S1-C subfamily serine protease
MLGTSLPKINHLAYVKGIDKQYVLFEINKKSGGKRQIRAPSNQLKNLQRSLKKLLEDLYKPHPAASAFVESRGIVYNASKHVKKSAVFNIDLEDFYGKIHFGRVRGALMAKPYSLRKDTAQLIAHLCCVDKVLPQGAPTSPVLSNIICKPLDRELSYLARSNRAFYTRYADDITFSFRTRNDNEIVAEKPSGYIPSEKLENIIVRHGFSINRGKTRFQTCKERQTVTGLKVNEKLNVDRRYIRATRAMIHALDNGVEVINEKYRKINKNDLKDNLAPMVAGRLNFIGMVKGIDSSVYQGLAGKFNGLELKIKVKTDPLTYNDKKFSGSFFRRESKLRLERCVWIVSFEGVGGLSLDEELVQGTAFALPGGRILTAAHIFKKAGDPTYCFLNRVSQPTKKYKAKLIRKNKVSDVAELQFVDDMPGISYLKLTENEHVNIGYQVAVVGFPQLLPGHRSVSVKPCHIVNDFTKSTFEHREVDVNIHGGNSGGPVVDGYLNVVGMATMGVGVSYSQDDIKPDVDSKSIVDKVASIGFRRMVLNFWNKLHGRASHPLTIDDVRREIHLEINKINANVAIEGTNAFVSSKHFSDF